MTSHSERQHLGELAARVWEREAERRLREWRRTEAEAEQLRQFYRWLVARSLRVRRASRVREHTF